MYDNGKVGGITRSGKYISAARHQWIVKMHSGGSGTGLAASFFKLNKWGQNSQHLYIVYIDDEWQSSAKQISCWQVQLPLPPSPLPLFTHKHTYTTHWVTNVKTSRSPTPLPKTWLSPCSTISMYFWSLRKKIQIKSCLDKVPSGRQTRRSHFICPPTLPYQKKWKLI